MDDETCFQILLVSPVHHLVEPPEPGQRGLVGGCETVVEVDETVVNVNILVQGQHQVTENNFPQINFHSDFHLNNHRQDQNKDTLSRTVLCYYEHR